ncbi:MAG TPA: non-ribosomal peptide synthetase, partial [Acidobacteria bacterium]|nr:non-ribosomal peptide synthetase [Acidobacteriota bacterium]
PPPPRRSVRPLPVDRPDEPGTVASTRALDAELDAEETRALLEEVPAAYHTRIQDVLATALVQAFAGWTGTPSLLVDLEGHGRDEIFDGADASRTVGWLTAVYPVLLTLGRIDLPPGESLRAIKEQLRAVPQGGIGYGLLRHVAGGEAAERLQSLPAAQVAFNYLG